MSSASPEKPRRRARLPADPWARKLTIPEWKYLIIDRPRYAWAGGVLAGLFAIVLLRTTDWMIAAAVLVLLTALVEWINHRSSKR